MISSIVSFIAMVLGAAIAVGIAMFACFAVCYAYDCVLNWFTDEH